MKNIIKAEFHKIFHGIAFYEFPIIIFLIFWIQELTSNKSYADRHFIDILYDTLYFMVVVILFTGIFMVRTWSKERKNGYIKNIAGNVSGRHILTLAKLITGSVVTVIYSFISLASGVVVGFIASLVNGGKFRFSSAESAASLWMKIGAFFIWIVAGIAIVAMLLMIYEIFRSAGFGYVMAIQVLPNLLESILAQGVYLLFKFEELGQYLIISGTKMMLTSPKGELIAGINAEEYFPNSMLGVLVRLCLYIAVFTIVSVFVSRKRDV